MLENKVRSKKKTKRANNKCTNSKIVSTLDHASHRCDGSSNKSKLFKRIIPTDRRVLKLNLVTRDGRRHESEWKDRASLYGEFVG